MPIELYSYIYSLSRRCQYIASGADDIWPDTSALRLIPVRILVRYGQEGTLLCMQLPFDMMIEHGICVPLEDRIHVPDNAATCTRYNQRWICARALVRHSPVDLQSRSTISYSTTYVISYHMSISF